MDRMYKITTDNTADLPYSFYKENDIDFLFLPYTLEDKQYTLENELPVAEFYDRMRNGSMPTTSQYNAEDAAGLWEPYLKQGVDILHIAFSSGLSGSYNSARLAAEDMREKYPERKIICVDSLRYSTALAMLVMLACRKRDEGASIEECAEYVNETKHRIHQIGAMDDLFFLVKTGRISNFKALFGSMVGVNPMADFNSKGLSEVIYKAKGKKTALEAAVKYIKKLAVNPAEQTMFIAHSDRQAAAELLRGCEMVVLESNHDPHMLQAGPYPYSLKMRVAGPSGHLSNPDCAVFAADLVKSGTRTLVLAHLSEKNNMPELARQQTLSALRGLPACEVLVAPKEHMEHPVSFGEEKLCSLSG